jgi:hypothetical protein
MEYLEWELPEYYKRKARVELNFFECSDSKWYYSEPDVVEYKKGSKLQIWHHFLVPTL